MKKRTQIVSVTSGKGGVGKTTLVANMAVTLAQAGDRVLIFDGDLGMANVDIFFGVRPEGTLYDVLSGKKTIREILTEVAPGIHLLPGGSGLPEFQSMNHFQRRALLESVSELPHDFGWMLIDTAPGIADNVLYLNAAAEKIMVVITPDPASLADSYALIKVLHQRMKEKHFTIVCNQVRDSQEGLGLFHRFQEVVSKFLDVGLDYGGSVPVDAYLKKATQMQRLVSRHEPQCMSAAAIRDICARLGRTVRESEIKGGLQMFWEQVVGVA